MENGLEAESHSSVDNPASGCSEIRFEIEGSGFFCLERARARLSLARPMLVGVSVLSESLFGKEESRNMK